MNERSPQILILGGGVTGMSSALALKDQDVAVHLVEKSNYLGGHAAQWACMATTTCQNCGACLAQEMAASLKSQTNTEVHTHTTLTTLSKGNSGLNAVLSNGKTLTPDAVIMATGFTPYDPGGIASYHTKTLNKVITTAELNTLIREETLTALTGPAPKIAFLQCVGSRNRKENRDYCSQVCCNISIRHAKKLLHLLPGAAISLFYMDLQVIGKEARTAARELAHSMELVQGVPAEIFESPEKKGLTMIVEDPSTLARVARQFDLVVLSVGMTAAQGNRETCDILGITPNTWGFFNTEEAVAGKKIIVAGCARGPKTILSCQQEGRVAAARILRSLEADRSKTNAPLPAIAVIGAGAPALTAATAAAAEGYPTYSFGHHSMLPDGIHDLGAAKIRSIEGVTGNFTLAYENNGKKETLCCGAIIAAPVPGRQNRAIHFPKAATLDTFAETPLQDRPDKTIILLDYFGPENKEFSRLALTEALASCQAGKTIYILMRNMLVHGPEGQLTYDKARKAGVKFLRFDTKEDVAISKTDSGIGIVLKESTLPGRDITLKGDCLVVPDAVAPTALFKDTADLLKVDLDKEGFIQSPNTRHRLIRSPRRGLFFAGPGHDETDGTDLAEEIRAIMADIELDLRALPQKATPRVTINEKACAKCLTCFRICPHSAVILNERRRPQIMDRACFSCQACVSNCPAYAIEAEGFDNNSLAERAGNGKTMILACERSGALAAESKPEGTDLVVIPCACRISADMLIKPLIQGVERVIVSACHPGNCRSGNGHALARKQVEKAAAMPGIGQEKLRFQTAAANEPRAFARMISRG